MYAIRSYYADAGRLKRLENEARAALVPGDFVGSFAGVHKGQTALSAVADGPVEVSMLSHKELNEVLAAHRDLDGVDLAFREHGLMLGDHVFAGSGRLPGGFSRLKPVSYNFV